MNCKNCQKELDGLFCNQCGQKSNIQRINFKYIVNEIPNSIFQLNRGFLFTVKELFLRPGNSIREYLSGKRVNHYKPIAFLIITTSIYVLTAYLLEKNTYFYDFLMGWQERGSGPNSENAIKNQAILSKYQVYIPLIILPIYSLSTYIVFIKSKLNYFEHFIVNTYITGQQMIIYWFLGFIFFKDNVFLIVPVVLGFAYNIWSFHQLFSNKKSIVKFGLILLSYFVFILLLILIMSMVALIIKVRNS